MGVSAAREIKPGTIAFFGMASPPAGWLKANGAAVSRQAYAALFAAYGTTHGAGDGATTFNLPDLRGEFVRCWDDGRGLDAGRGFATVQGDEIRSHTHAFTEWGNNAGPYMTYAPYPGFYYNEAVLQTAAAGGAETRPRNIAMLACVKI